MNTRTWVGILFVVSFSVVICVPAVPADPRPFPHGKAGTPQTRTLTVSEAARVLEQDWLFQAMGEPLLQRAAKEIGWARELAERLARNRKAPDLSADLKELDALAHRLVGLSDKPATAQPTKRAEAVPSWVWYPEDQPVEDAPAESRFFRRWFEVDANVREAVVRIAADDVCEVFLNGTRVGAHATWQRTAAFAVGPLLKTGSNLLAVRAENRPASGKNPAGLIARLDVTLPNERQLTVVSDSSWRTESETRLQWEETAFDDSGWKPVAVVAPFGGGPWGKIAGLSKADLPDDPVAAYADTAPAVRRLYFSVRRVKRNILLKNPVLDFTQLLFIDQPLPQGPESRHEAIHRMGIMAVPGGRLVVLDGLHPAGELRQLAPGKPGSFWRPDLSFDAKKVLFCYKPHDEKSFHLYERPDLPARRPHSLHHHAGQLVCPLRSVHLLVYLGPLRR
jgi:hypothetical protein